MIRMFVIVGFAVLMFFFLRWLSRQPRRVQWQAIAGAIAVMLLFLVVTGRAHWLAAVFATFLAFIKRLAPLLSHIPLIRRVLAGTKPSPSGGASDGGKTSTVNSRYIAMSLNHETGAINGEVLEGKFKGNMLDNLELSQLLELLEECLDDDESVALLQAYLDRNYEDVWKEQASAHHENRSGGDTGRMSRDEAIQILGISPEPSDEEIIQAHRRLMQTVHPDRGGSAYLAAKNNLAKETLMSG